MENRVPVAHYYFIADGSEDMACPISYWEDYLEEHELDEVELCPARRMVGEPYFFCRHHWESMEKDPDTCGKFCDGYSPRNGKSGICNHWRHTYEPDTSKKFTLKTH